ncbi:hypothetical protein [Amycolatopsis solani]|uniref:hypothetical protein n=1 Tax=Amycolatopsis solani TaxID=3028615 RepID=UPI0025B06C94|nr:hypothetical protein [Amycolatopsis sp. MEP2-6]
MSPLVSATIQTIPRALLLVVGLLGLIFAIKARARGGSGLMVAAFVVMLVTTVAGIVWQFVSLDAASWISSDDLSASDLGLIFTAVALPLDAAAVLSWLLVALAVVKGGRPRHPGYAPPPGYPMAGPPPGYSQPQN